MNPRAKWATVAAIAVVAIAAAMPWRFWQDALRRELAESVRATTGLEARVSGRVTIALLPRPRVDFEHVAIREGADAPLLTAEKLRGDLRVLPLLVGRVRFSAATLFDAQAYLDDPVGARERIASRLADPGRPIEAVAERLGQIRFEKAALRVRDVGSQDVTDIDATLSWPSPSSAASLSGAATWGGERFSLEALLSTPAEALRGDRSPLAVKIVGREAEASFNGMFGGGRRWLLEGRVAATTERLRQVLALFDRRLMLPGALRSATLAAHIRALPTSLDFSNLKVTLDGRSLDGTAALRLDGPRPALSATLAARALEYDHAEIGAPPVRSPSRRWSRTPLNAPRLDHMDADVRLSVTRLRLGRLALSNVGLVATAVDGRVDLNIAGAEAYSGKVKGRIGLTTAAGALETRVTLSFADVDAAAFLRSVAQSAKVYGSATGDIAVESSGDNVAAMMRQARGSLRLGLRKGDIIGMDVEQALRRSEKRPLSIAAEVRSGQTSFLTADVVARIASGVVTLETARVAGHGVEMSAAGAVDLGERTVRLDISATTPRPAGANANADASARPALDLDLVGPWDDPTLTLDVEALIRRSTAAAPLFRRRVERPAADAGAP